MDWREALEIADEGRIERFRWLCSNENPDQETREGYRAFMVRRATGEPEPPMPLLQEVIPGLGSLADLPGPDRIEPGCRPCH